MAAESTGDPNDGEPEVSELELIELERARIGHEIHDSLLPLIFASAASLHGLVDDDRAGEEGDLDADRSRRLHQVTQWLDDALQVGRQILVEVYPPELAGRDWERAVADTLARITDAPCEITWQVDPDVNDQPAAILSAAYRIVVEAVRNAIRHGHATKILITAKIEDELWSVTVSDNGDGFDATAIPRDRFGVRTMIGRAKLAGGTCVVNSKVGGPTALRFQWPAKVT